MSSKVSFKDIPGLETDWASNPEDEGKPFSGESVQKFIKSFLGKIAERLDSEVDSKKNVVILRGYNKAGEEVLKVELPIISDNTGSGSDEGEVGVPGTVDTKMSDTSANAIANKTVKAYIDRLIPADFNNDFNDDFTN